MAALLRRAFAAPLPLRLVDGAYPNLGNGRQIFEIGLVKMICYYEQILRIFFVKLLFEVVLIFFAPRANARMRHQIVRRVGKEDHLFDIPESKRLFEHAAHGGVALEVIVALVEKVGRLGIIFRHEKALRAAQLVKAGVVVRPNVVERGVSRPAADIIAENAQLQAAVAVEHFQRLISLLFVLRLA